MKVKPSAAKAGNGISKAGHNCAQRKKAAREGLLLWLLIAYYDCYLVKASNDSEDHESTLVYGNLRYGIRRYGIPQP